MGIWAALGRFGQFWAGDISEVKGFKSRNYPTISRIVFPRGGLGTWAGSAQHFLRGLGTWAGPAQQIVRGSGHLGRAWTGPAQQIFRGSGDLGTASGQIVPNIFQVGQLSYNYITNPPKRSGFHNYGQSSSWPLPNSAQRF